MRFLGILGIFGIFLEILEIFEILGICEIFRDFWDFWDYFMELLTEECKSDFFGVITDVSTKIQMCQPKEILSANKAGMCGI